MKTNIPEATYKSNKTNIKSLHKKTPTATLHYHSLPLSPSLTITHCFCHNPCHSPSPSLSIPHYFPSQSLSHHHHHYFPSHNPSIPHHHHQPTKITSNYLFPHHQLVNIPSLIIISPHHHCPSPLDSPLGHHPRRL